jgi:putative hydrolase of the HAD superfamily
MHVERALSDSASGCKSRQRQLAIERMLKAIFFDAAGTLIYLPKGVGYHYAAVAKSLGLELDERALGAAFVSIWKQMPARPATGQPREDDDKGWWRDLVNRVLDQVAPAMRELDRDNFFEIAYEHFAEPGVWELYPEVLEVLDALHRRFELSVISNFDGRLRVILEHLGLTKYFRRIFLSSELGADKPDPMIFQLAMKASGFSPNEILHVGDDPERDWSAAANAGLRVFELDRKKNSLRHLLSIL